MHRMFKNVCHVSLTVYINEYNVLNVNRPNYIAENPDASKIIQICLHIET